MDKPYIEYCGQGWSWYGNIYRFDLLRDRVKVQMNSDAAEHMGNDGFIEVAFALSDAEFATLRAALARTVRGQPYYFEQT
jgi:hypothetical protein